MTAPNTPTPELELVERLRKEIPYNADGFRELRDLADEAAATIARLTGERNEALEQRAKFIREAGKYFAENCRLEVRAEAAERRVKELESELASRSSWENQP